MSGRTFSIRCGGETHRVTFQDDGSTQLHDHPEARGELIVHALGGNANPPPCFRVHTEWLKTQRFVAYAGSNGALANLATRARKLGMDVSWKWEGTAVFSRGGLWRTALPEWDFRSYVCSVSALNRGSFYLGQKPVLVVGMWEDGPDIHVLAPGTGTTLRVTLTGTRL